MAKPLGVCIQYARYIFPDRHVVRIQAGSEDSRRIVGTFTSEGGGKIFRRAADESLRDQCALLQQRWDMLPDGLFRFGPSDACFSVVVIRMDIIACVHPTATVACIGKVGAHDT